MNSYIGCRQEENQQSMIQGFSYIEVRLLSNEIMKLWLKHKNIVKSNHDTYIIHPHLYLLLYLYTVTGGKFRFLCKFDKYPYSYDKSYSIIQIYE